MTQNERILKEEVIGRQESFTNANSLAAAESSKQAKEISKLEKSIQDLEAAKAVIEDDLKKTKLDAEAST